jgi:sodium/potassium-transporting ATPase subunit alpha
VAFIPEGLPVALTASMTISANMMRKNKILCKSLKTVETLGSVSVICSDKTGTLTQVRPYALQNTSQAALLSLTTVQNKMLVTECVQGNQRMTADAARDAIITNRTQSPTNNSLDQLGMIACLCNAGEFDAATIHMPLYERIIHGDATDQAILRFAESLGSTVETRRSWQMRYELAFNSKNKFMIRCYCTSNQEAIYRALPAGIASVFQPGDM